MEKEKVLVVDDEENIRRLVRSILGNKYLVLEAKNGEEAVSIARSYKPCLVLMDILMPKMDGYTACSTIKKDPATGAVIVVMLTAVGFELNKTLAKQVGADGYITKPFSPQDLLNTIDRCLTKHK